MPIREVLDFGYPIISHLQIAPHHNANFNSQYTNAMIHSYQVTARANMIMQTQMGIWSIFITVVRQREVRHHCAPDALYVVEKVKPISPIKGPNVNNRANISTGGGCVSVRACAENGTVSYDPVDAHIRVCDAELCNDECEDCECSDSAASILSITKALNLAMMLKFLSNLLYP